MESSIRRINRYRGKGVSASSPQLLMALATAKAAVLIRGRDMPRSYAPINIRPISELRGDLLLRAPLPFDPPVTLACQHGF
jgi:hypothetical protein